MEAAGGGNDSEVEGCSSGPHKQDSQDSNQDRPVADIIQDEMSLIPSSPPPSYEHVLEEVSVF